MSLKNNAITKALMGGVSFVFVTALLTSIASATGYNRTLNITQALLDTYSCNDSEYGLGGAYMIGSPGYGERSIYTAGCAKNNTANASGAVVTATQTLRAATAQTVGLINTRINTVREANRRINEGIALTALSLSPDLNKGEIGLAGGDHKKGVGVWLQGRFTDVEVDSTASAFTGDVTTGMFGIDKSFKNGKIIIGLAGGFEDQDFETTFNKGTIDGDGFMISPYVSVMLNKNFSINVAGGFADLSYDFTRKDSITLEKFTATTDATRNFFSGMLNLDKRMKKGKGHLRLGVRAGATHSNESKDAYTETGTTGTTVAIAAVDTHVTQGIFGAEVGYQIGKIEPFVNVAGEVDIDKTSAVTVGPAQTQPADSDFGTKIGGGLNIFFSPNASAMISGETVLGRDDYSETSGTAQLRIDF